MVGPDRGAAAPAGPERPLAAPASGHPAPAPPPGYPLAGRAINSGPHARARAWSRAIYAAYPEVQGLWYCSSMDADEPCLALYERAVGALPAAPSFHAALADPRMRLLLARQAAVLGYVLVAP